MVAVDWLKRHRVWQDGKYCAGLQSGIWKPPGRRRFPGAPRLYSCLSQSKLNGVVGTTRGETYLENGEVLKNLIHLRQRRELE